MRNKSLEKAFTLAEVLIVLVLMGVITTLSIRGISDERAKQETVVRLQKTYEEINKAIANGILENGSMDYWDFSLSQSEFIKTYLSSLETDFKNPPKFSDVWGNKVLKYYEISGAEERNFAIMQDPTNFKVYTLKNGAQIIAEDDNSQFYNKDEENNRITFWVDINGIKQPNTIGKDMFALAVTSEGTLRLTNWDDGQDASETIDKSREDLIKGSSKYRYQCNKENRGYWCGALIQKDGWKISKDYPWNVGRK